MIKRPEPWPKVCRCAQETWCSLSFVGYADGGSDDELELRNCSCGSTLAVRSPESEEL